jgi:uncharacterized repeat protein (TIGR03833 family)
MMTNLFLHSENGIQLTDTSIHQESNLITTPRRNEITPGIHVQVIEKQNQRSGILTEGVVARLLTSSPTHPHGIKVMLTDGKVGRVQSIIKPAGNRHSSADEITSSSEEKPSTTNPA